MTADVTDHKVNPVKSFIAGGFGGICRVISCYPLDTIMVRLQTMPPPAVGQSPRYKGVIDCTVKIYSREGVRGFYRGLGAPLIGVVPFCAVDFGVFAAGKRLLQSDDQVKLSYKQIALAGVGSGICSALVTVPTDRIKLILQTQPNSGRPLKYNGIIDTAFKLYKQGGLQSLYKGTCACLLRESPSCVYFVVYESVQDFARQRFGHLTPLSIFFAGGLAGIAFETLSMPFEVLKSRLLSAPEGTYNHGVRSVFRELMATEGPKALYRGLSTGLIRAFPSNGVVFIGVELANDLMNF